MEEKTLAQQCTRTYQGQLNDKVEERLTALEVQVKEMCERFDHILQLYNSSVESLQDHVNKTTRSDY